MALNCAVQCYIPHMRRALALTLLAPAIAFAACALDDTGELAADASSGADVGASGRGGSDASIPWADVGWSGSGGSGGLVESGVAGSGGTAACAGRCTD